MTELTLTPRKQPRPEIKVQKPLTVTPRNVAPVVEEPERPSDPFKQGLAGISDAITGIPSVLGMADAGIEATIKNIFEPEDRPFSEHFSEAIADNPAFNIGVAGREFVNESLGIEDPVSTEDQASRLLTSMVLPIPGSSSTSLLNKAMSFALPIVRTGQGVGTRAAAQVGIGTAIDQGSRAVTDQPLLLSDEAITGIPFDPNARPSIQLDPTIDPTTDDGVNKLRQLDQKVQREQDTADNWRWLLYGGSLVAAAGVARHQLKNIIQKHGSYKKFGEHVFEDQVDASDALGNSLRAEGHSEDVINNVVHNSHTDPMDMARNYLDTGSIGQDFKIPAGLTPRSLHELNQQYIGLGDNQQVFNDAMLASIDRAARHNDKATNLWANAKPTAELDRMIESARAIPAVKQLMDDMGQQYEILLEYQKFRGVLSQAEVDKFRQAATGPSIDNAPGRVSYMPIYSPDETTMWERMANKYLNIGGKTQREVNYLAEHGPRNLDTAGKSVDPMEAFQKYAIHSIADANEQSFKYNVLQKLSKVSKDQFGFVSRSVDARGRELATARDTTYIGSGSNLDDPASITIDHLSGRREFKGKTIGDLHQQYPGEIVTAHYGGQLHAYHVPDRGLRAALELNPQLSDMQSTMSAWKNLFTQGTTGKASLFAPISHAFSAQQVALNTAARDGLMQGGASVFRGLKGTAQLATINGAKNISDFLSQRIGRHIANTGAPPPMIQGLQQRLEGLVVRSTLNQIRTESGRTVSGIGNIGHGTMDEVMASVGKPSVDYFGKDQIGLVGNLWESWNNAWHEGPAYGAMLKHIGDARNNGDIINGKVIRDAVDVSKSLAGDMRRRGASEFAQMFNASVPFSSAMIQSWNSLGSAAKAHPVKFTTGAMALIGMPTISEMVYNNNLSENSPSWQDKTNPEKSWTYNDYYWNGYTTQQRTDNFIYFVPGQAPWDAILVPVSPEWGLFRAVTMEAADAAFGFSAVGAMGDQGTGIQVDQAKVNRSHFMQALSRVADIPLPPVIAAAGSAVGADVRLGLSTEISDDPDDPGAGVSFVRNVPLGQGERITRRGGQTKFAEGHLDKTTTAILQDIFGAAGAAYVNFHEAVATGVTRKGGSIAEGLDRGFEALGQSAKSQARYTQPLLGQAMHPNASVDEITENLVASKNAMTNLSNQLASGYIQGGVLFTDGKPVLGDTVIPSDDPINMELSAYSKGILSSPVMRELDGKISEIQKNLTTIPNARNLGNLQARNDLKDSLTLELQSLRAHQLSIIHQAESEMSRVLTERYKRQIDIDFTSFKPRGQLNSSSILQELQTTPPTSE